jgi:hypothetical protein
MGNPLATEKYVATAVAEKVAEVVALPEGVASLIDPATGKINAALSPLAIAIKPFKFKLEDMNNVLHEGALLPTYTISIPGFVVTLVNDATGMVMGDMEYSANGDTIVTFVDLDESVLSGNKEFTAFAFVNKDGSKIEVLDTQVLGK